MSAEEEAQQQAEREAAAVRLAEEVREAQRRLVDDE